MYNIIFSNDFYSLDVLDDNVIIFSGKKRVREEGFKGEHTYTPVFCFDNGFIFIYHFYG